ncbi:MAG: hypothetical protein AB3N13_08560 [Arenibacterium sp.]
MTTSRYFKAVEPSLVGDNTPSVRPGLDPLLYGSATLEPRASVEVRSYQTFTLVYTVGRIGLDDTGAIRVAFRIISDAGKPQTSDPAAPGYLTATCSGSGRISLAVSMDGQRPWNLIVTAGLHGGYLAEGEQITLVFGDTTHGSPGLMMQTFAEGGFDFNVMADVQATGNFQPLAERFSVPIVAGPATKWVALLPSLRRPGEAFHFGLKAEDMWGNPTSQASGHVTLDASLPVEGLPNAFEYTPQDRSMLFENLRVTSPGVLRVRVSVDGKPVTEAGPLVIREGDLAGFWGDLHGQTGETIGINTIESYFDFARNKAFLDVSAHQGNDFQIKPAFWTHLNEVTAQWDEPERFTVFPGYEWSGNTAVGGDHNVFFATEGRAIRRCSHALLEDQSELESDATTLSDLYAALVDEDAVVYAHVGGRYANIHYDHDPSLETAVEVHSAWGTFEWVLTDGFDLGRRVGVVCNSDGHKGRPGASYPGASTFGAYGGLTCFLAPRNDRASIMEAQRRRHHFGTTGCRLHMDVSLAMPDDARICLRNPDADPDTERLAADRAIMGDIVETTAQHISLHAQVLGASGLERVELRNGTRVIEVLRPYDEADLGRRIRVVWSGAEYRGRGRDTIWRGQARFAGTRINRFKQISHWNPERLLKRSGSDAVVWDTITTGNFTGFDAWTEDNNGELRITTNHGDLTLDLAEIGREPIVMEAGGLARKLCVQRLPDAPLARELDIKRDVALNISGDDPLWIAVTTEDGHQAWSSPIYVIAPQR